MKLCPSNIGGMNAISKRAVLKGVVQSFRGECLLNQETKTLNIDTQIISLLSALQLVHQGYFY